MGLIWFAVVGLVFLWPISKVLVRTGFSPWYCLLAIVPVINVVALWLFATSEWPTMKGPTGP